MNSTLFCICRQNIRSTLHIASRPREGFSAQGDRVCECGTGHPLPLCGAYSVLHRLLCVYCCGSHFSQNKPLPSPEILSHIKPCFPLCLARLCPDPSQDPQSKGQWSSVLEGPLDELRIRRAHYHHGRPVAQEYLLRVRVRVRNQVSSLTLTLILTLTLTRQEYRERSRQNAAVKAADATERAHLLGDGVRVRVRRRA